MAGTLRRTVTVLRWPLVTGAVLAAGVSAARLATGAQRDELPRYTFTVAIDGLTTAAFRRVSGIGVEAEVIEYRDGATNDVRKLPGRTTWSSVVLTREFSGDPALLQWMSSHAATGNVVRRTVTVRMLDAGGRLITRWTLHNAWPVKWQGPTLQASGNEVAIESLELAHEGFSVSRDDDDR